MIPLNRVRSVEAVADVFRDPERTRRERELMELIRAAKQEGKKPSFRSSRWRPSKDQLKRESHNKCAYCEADTAVVAHGDVEHFRPKSKYWWLAYCYDNYLYSCQICNQSFKVDNFRAESELAPPVTIRSNTAEGTIDANAGRLAPDPFDDAMVAAFSAETTAERAHLPDPYHPDFDPSALFVWEEDGVNGEVILKRRGNGVAARRAVKACEDHLGLNREELKRLRFARYDTLRTLKDSLLRIQELAGASDPLVTAIREKLEDMVADHSEYAGMSRFFVNEEWELGIPIP